MNLTPACNIPGCSTCASTTTCSKCGANFALVAGGSACRECGAVCGAVCVYVAQCARAFLCVVAGSAVWGGVVDFGREGRAHTPLSTPISQQKNTKTTHNHNTL